jgi:hypothetical protein
MRKIFIAIGLVFMALTYSFAGMVLQPVKIIVDQESEKNTAWADGTVVYVKATSKYYQLSSGVFSELTIDDKYWKADGTLGSPSGSGATNIDGGFANTNYGQISGIDGGGAT